MKNLHELARMSEWEALRNEIENGADINTQDERGWTLLHICAAIGGMNKEASEMIMYLLEKGADVTKKEYKTRFTPLDRAKDNGSSLAIDYLSNFNKCGQHAQAISTPQDLPVSGAGEKHAIVIGSGFMPSPVDIQEIKNAGFFRGANRVTVFKDPIGWGNIQDGQNRVIHFWINYHEEMNLEMEPLAGTEWDEHLTFPDGRKFYVCRHLNPARPKAGVVTGVAATSRDSSEDKASAQQDATPSNKLNEKLTTALVSTVTLIISLCFFYGYIKVEHPIPAHLLGLCGIIFAAVFFNSVHQIVTEKIQKVLPKSLEKLVSFAYLLPLILSIIFAYYYRGSMVMQRKIDGFRSHQTEEYAIALGESGDKRVVKPLIEALEYKNEDVRRASADALGKIGDKTAIEPLIQRLADVSSVRKAAVKSLNKMGETKWNAWIKGNEEDFLRLGKSGEPKAVKVLIAGLENGDGELAAKALGELGDKQAVEPLIKRGLGRYSISATIKALGQLGDQRAVEPLIEALGNSFRDCRITAAEALFKLGETKWKKLIKGDSEDFIRLGNSGDPRAFEPLIIALQNNDLSDKKAVVKGLGNLGDKRAIEPLKKTIADEDAKQELNLSINPIRELANEALAKLGNKQIK